jgi:SulP family sulfate permease
VTSAAAHSPVPSALVPKLFTLLKSYDRRQFAADAVAGVVVGVVALPLSIAFAIASGLPPQAGLYTAIIAGAIVSVLGGSRVQIAGPTGAFVVIVYGIVQTHGVAGLTVATIMAGVILVALGFARLGAAIKFIPHPVVTGFTSGIALIIFTGQVRDLVGLPVTTMPAAFLAQVGVIAERAAGMNAWAPLVAGLSLAIVVFWPRISTRVPSPFVALIITTALVQLADIPVETIGSRFGTIDASFPRPAFPAVSLESLQALVAPAFAIAMLGGIESLLSAVVADGMTGGRHRSNMELIAQGTANIITPMFGGIPATGAIARTATNIRAGARTPISGIVHSFTLLVITLFVGRWVALIPMATIAGILVVVAWHMSEWHTFRATLRAPRSDVAVLLVTFALTVFVDLTVALGVGMVLASFLFMRKMSEVTEVRAVTGAFRDEYFDDATASATITVPAGVEIFEIDGPFFFGAAETFKETIAALERPPAVLILRLRKVGLLDATGLALLRDLAQKRGGGGVTLILAEVQPQPLQALKESRLIDEIGIENFAPDIELALARAQTLVSALPPRRRSGSSRSLPSFGPE